MEIEFSEGGIITRYDPTAKPKTVKVRMVVESMYLGLKYESKEFPVEYTDEQIGAEVLGWALSQQRGIVVVVDTPGSYSYAWWKVVNPSVSEERLKNIPAEVWC